MASRVMTGWGLCPGFFTLSLGYFQDAGTDCSPGLILGLLKAERREDGENSIFTCLAHSLGIFKEYLFRGTFAIFDVFLGSSGVKH